jgi:hypothetical protein
VYAEEPGRHHRRAGGDERQRPGQGEQDAGRGDQASGRDDGAAPEPIGQPAGDRGAHRADRIDQEDQAGGGEAQAERRRRQPEVHRVVDGHERAHRAGADRVQREQTGVGDRPPGHREQIRRRAGRGVKCRDGGSRTATAAAHRTPTAAIAASASRPGRRPRR